MSKRERKGDQFRKLVNRISEGYHRETEQNLTPLEELQMEYEQLLLAKAADVLEDTTRLHQLKKIIDEMKSQE